MQAEKTELKNSLIFILFIISGATGLIYQVIWFKYLALFLGNSTYAQMIVLSTFLGGLALGNYLFGKKAQTIKNPVMIYGLLEFGIGVYCLIYPASAEFFGNLLLSFVRTNDLSVESLYFFIARFLLSSSLLLLPTILMGGTLPLLSDYFVKEFKFSQRDTAVLYFLNSFGAVIGIFFAGFILIKTFGLYNSIFTTAIINIALGITAIVISIGLTRQTIVKPTEEHEGNSSINNKTITFVIITAGLSGLAALVYEMVWVRLLSTIFGSSTYAFSLMLMAFISGITLGSLIVSKEIFGKINKITLIILCQIFIALGMMIILPFYERLPYELWRIASLFVNSETAFDYFLIIEFVISFLLIFIPTIFMGMSLPAAVGYINEYSENTGKTVGKVFSINTLGTVAGVLLTGLILLPTLGVKGSFEFGIGVNLIAAILLITVKEFSIIKKITFSAVVIIGFILYLIVTPKWSESGMLSGVFRSFKFLAPATYSEYKSANEKKTVLFYKEGISANVGVVNLNDSLNQKIMIVNGKPEASNYLDMPTQVLISQIPLMLHSNPKNVFLVGLGSGVTAGSALTHPVDEVLCLEISKDVIEAAKFFNDVNGNCLTNDKLKIIVEDAQTYLKSVNKKFDVIISEPSNPWIAGIGNLFSYEYFNLCKKSLNPNGIMVQWFHHYEMNDDVVKLVLHTFSEVFEFSQLWISIYGDMILIGSNEPIQPDYKLIHDKFNYPSINQDFNRIGIKNLFTFFSLQSLSYEGFYSISKYHKINSETHPHLEFLAPRAFFVGHTSNYIYDYDERYTPGNEGLFVTHYIKKYPPTYNEIFETIEYLFNKSKNNMLAYGLTQYLYNNFPISENTLEYLLRTANAAGVQLENMVHLDGKRLFPKNYNIVVGYVNKKIYEIENAVTFLGSQSILKYAEMLKPFLSLDTVKRAKTELELALLFLKNNEIEKADSLSNIISQYLTNDDSLGFKIPIDDFCYLNIMIGIKTNDFKRSMDYLLGLITINTNYKHKDYLMRRLSWMMK